MTRCFKGLGSFVAPIALLAFTTAGLVAAWVAFHLNEQAWAQTLDRDRSAIDADMVSARAAHTNGDDPAKFLAYCHTAVDTYNADATQAGSDLPTGYQRHLDSDQECQLQEGQPS